MKASEIRNYLQSITCGSYSRMRASVLLIADDATDMGKDCLGHDYARFLVGDCEVLLYDDKQTPWFYFRHGNASGIIHTSGKESGAST